jgi:hypothetical protein
MSKVKDVMVMNAASVTSSASITEAAQKSRQSGQRKAYSLTVALCHRLRPRIRW